MYIKKVFYHTVTQIEVENELHSMDMALDYIAYN